MSFFPSMESRFRTFIRGRFSRESMLGLHFTLGILFLTLATWIFAHLAEDIVNHDPLTITDLRFSNWLHTHSTPWLTRVLLIVTNLHSTLGITILTIPIAVYLWRLRLRRRIIGLIVTIYGGMLLNVWLKLIFQRARPHFDDPLLSLTSYSFPSGHTMAATVFYGVLCVIILSRVTDWRWRLLTIFAALFMIALVGFSRIYLGVHYLSDVIGAMVEGAAWLTICLTAFETLRQRRRLRQNSNA
jgi:membrane-associated phospholipid phosphatase